MIAIESIELHDARLKSMCIYYEKKCVTISVDFYAQEGERERVATFIEFQGVETISQISNLEHLQKNAFAGNINYWVPAIEGGVTYIYLTDGCISIRASKISCFLNLGT